jgi:predicted TIM-barrel fold metal-dependent hydrolase
VIDGMKVIDAHVHVWEADRPDRPRSMQVTPHIPELKLAEEYVPDMDTAGVDIAIQIPPAFVGVDNQYSFEAAESFPGRFFVFGLFNLMENDPAGRLERFVEQEWAVGVKLFFFGTAIEAAPDSSMLRPFWETAERLGIPISITAPGVLDKILTVLQRHPNLNVLLDHFTLHRARDIEFPADGLLRAPTESLSAQVDRLGAFLPFEQVRLKLSGLIEMSEEPFPFRDLHPHVRDMFEMFGASRIAWGANYPYVLKVCAYEQAVRWPQSCDFLERAQLERLMSGTMEELLPLGAR